jgi:photosystem II stability/assembly factor-like uncharacterized protein
VKLGTEDGEAEVLRRMRRGFGGRGDQPRSLAGWLALSGASFVLGAAGAIVPTSEAVGVPAPAGWSLHQAPGSTLTSVACPSRSNCWAVGMYGSPGTESSAEILASSDGGRSWTEQQVPDAVQTGSGSLAAVSCPDTETCWAVGQDPPSSGADSVPIVLATTDGGATWTTQTLPVQMGPGLTGLSCADDQHCVTVGTEVTAGGASPAAFFTADGGRNWEASNAPNSQLGLSQVDCPTANVCFATSPNFASPQNPGGVDKSVDGGSTWNTSYSGSNSGAISCPTANACMSISATGPATVITTTNGGSTWATGTSLNDPVSGLSCPDTRPCRVVGSSTAGTHDFGHTWSTDLTPDSSGSMDAVVCADVFNCTAVGTNSNSVTIIGNTTTAGSETTTGGGAFAGYWLWASDGGVFSFGAAPFRGSAGNIRLKSPVVSGAATPDGAGYWLVGADGGVFTYGDASFWGSMGGRPTAGPIIGIVSAPRGDGYALASSEGAVYGFGSLSPLSQGATHPASPVVGVTADDYEHMWLATASGDVIPVGSSTLSLGSMAGHRLAKPIVGITSAPIGQYPGYWLVASDGGIFSFGSAKFFGSTGAMRLNKPIVGAIAPDGGGYWLVASDGGVFSFGDANFYGSTGGIRLNRPIVSMG